MEKRFCALFFIIAVSLFLQTASAAYFSPSQVLDTAKQYSIFEGESLAPVEYTGSGSQKPLVLDGTGYWVLYFYPASAQPDRYSSSFQKVVISDEDGSVVTGEKPLKSLFGVDYYYSFERNTLLGDFGLTYSQLDTGVTQALLTIKAAQKNINLVRDRALKNSSSPELEDHFYQLDDLATQMVATLEDLQGQEIANGIISQRTFAQTADINAYTDSIDNYKPTFEKLAEFADKAEAFFALLSDSNAYAQLDSDSNQVLQKINNAGLGTDQLPSAKQIRESVLPAYESFKADRDEAVSSGVKNTLFRIAKADAKRAYDAEAAKSPSVQSVVSDYHTDNAFYEKCGMTKAAVDLESMWNNATDVMQRTASVDEYNSLPATIASIDAKRLAILSARSECLTGRTPTPTPTTTSGPSPTDIGIIVVVFALIAFGYMQYQKAQKQKKEEEEGEEAV